jgi:hypothetical protein
MDLNQNPVDNILGLEYPYARQSSFVPMRMRRTLEYHSKRSSHEQDGEMQVWENHCRAKWLYLQHEQDHESQSVKAKSATN